ncbi:MAG TPA: tetratricopeptide repeat protein [Nannocystis exedens]|nr:tetratricopeptide repeat protein [Nannocystis exedens]
MACLKRRRLAFAALVRALTEIDAEVLGRVIQAAEALPEVDECGDIEMLTAAQALPANPQEAAEVESLRGRLSEARIEDEMGRYERGLRISTEVLSRSDVLDYRPLQAEALFVHGSLLTGKGDYEAADEILNRGVWRADVVRDDELLAETMAMLLGVLAERSHYEQGYGWRPHAEAVIERLGGDSFGEARLLAELCALISLHGDDGGEAIELGTRALEITEGLFGRESIKNVGMLRVLGGAYYRAGKLEEAEQVFERELQLIEGRLGSEHPKVLACLNNLGAVKSARGDRAGALSLMRRSLALGETILGSEHPSLATTIYNIGTLLTVGERRNDAEAQTYLERALAINQKAHGREHRQNAMILHGLAALSESRDDLEGAIAYLEEAHAICGETLEERAPLALQIMGDLGELYDDQGQPEKALPLLERVFELSEMDIGRASLRAEAGFHLVKVLRQMESRKSEIRGVLSESLARFRGLYEDELYEKEHGEMVAQLELWARELADHSPNSEDKAGPKQNP